MADYKVVLVPTSAEEQTQALILEDVDFGVEPAWLAYIYQRYT
jgi:hypothetical protein